MQAVDRVSAFDDLVEGFRVAVRRDAEIKAGLKKRAEEVKDYWQQIAPIDTGEYAGSIRIREMKDRDGTPMMRVTAFDPAAHIIEYGSEDTPKFATRAKVASHFHDEPGE